LLVRKTVFDRDVFAFDPAKLAQFLPERVHEDRATRSSAIIKEANASDFSRLLRVSGNTKRKKNDAKNKQNDFLCMLLFYYCLLPHAYCLLNHLIRPLEQIHRNR